MTNPLIRLTPALVQSPKLTSNCASWVSFGLIVLSLSACSDDFVALIKAKRATSEMRGTI
jgi:hypothetical protein